MMLIKSHTMTLLEAYRTPPHIIRHSEKVAQIALFLSEELNRAGHHLDLCLVETGALLHDIAKVYSLENGANHARAGAEWLRRHGLGHVAPIVDYHVHIPDHEMRVSEVAVVNYSDKRVREHDVVTLEERFSDLIIRYGVDEVRRERITILFERTKALEHLLFTHLSFSPEELSTIMTDVRKRSIPVSSEVGAECDG